ncbi:MAG TPA: hypothetical protein VH370_13650 [Humisphaera sp.]|nr:hypothetical protein [Humisphaera sp.]
MLRFTSLRAAALTGAVCAVFSYGSISRADDAKPAPDSRPMSPNSREERAPNSNANDYPSAETREWANAATMSVHARTMYRRAQSELDYGIHRIVARFEHSHDFQDARADEQRAYADYAAAREKVMASLADNARYREILRLRDEMGSQLETRRANHSATRDELTAMAQLKMQYASDARAIEVQATENSADLKAARARMVAAGRKVNDMRSSFDDSLHDNAEVAQLRKNVADANVAMITSDAYAWTSALVADASIYYSQYLHRMDQGYYAPYGPAATSGYYSPYWGH